MKINERFTWASGLLEVKPAEHLLEIGCGAGILAEQVAGQLTKGTITAVDISAAMIKMALKRNKAFVDEGKASFLVSDFAKADLPADTYHKIYAFNVNFFWKNPSAELALITKSLKRNGQLYVFYQAPYDITIQAAKPIEEKLLANGYKIIDTVFRKMTPVSAFCIVAKP